ncbi:uncharacterized protein [Clytia hemisphaerica]|uniref:uncharacterized protein n=1 Tax=Clytia hemisphaerica TaxID=252671 RepID=UPI0034D3E4F5
MERKNWLKIIRLHYLHPMIASSETHSVNAHLVSHKNLPNKEKMELKNQETGTSSLEMTEKQKEDLTIENPLPEKELPLKTKEPAKKPSADNNEQHSKDKAPVPKGKKKISQRILLRDNNGSDELQIQCEYRTMKVFPWLKMNGELNSVLLRKFQENVLTHILLNPGVKQTSLISYFKLILFPEATMRLLKFLELNKSITKHYLVRRKTSLFGEPLSPSKGLSEDDVYYLPTMSTIMNMTDTNR